MSIAVHDRKESKTEFDNTYFKVYDDAVRLITNFFGAKDLVRRSRQGYINVMGDRVLKSVSDIGTYIRIANSIYPQFQSELEERRIVQDKSWRNNILKDCNACKRTINELDKLYNELFPIREVKIKDKRSKIIDQAFKQRYR